MADLNKLTEQPTSAALAVALVFAASYLILFNYELIGGVIAALSFSYIIFWLYCSVKRNSYIPIVNIAFLFVIYSPYINYAKEIDGVRHFGSAYGIDFQQYLSVLWSLITQGVPFKNPYLPSESSVYHYGFMMPLAALLRISGGTNFYGFFDFSNYLFTYQVVTSFIFLQFVANYFFGSTPRRWFFAMALMFIFSSYKWLYSGLILFFASSSGNFDTQFGFKTPANDFLFGSHYVFSMLLVLYIFWYLSNAERLITKSQRYFGVATSSIAAFSLPVINVFSLLVIFAVYFSNSLSAIFITKSIRTSITIAISTCYIPVFAYLGYLVLISPATNQSSAYFSFSISSVPLLTLSLIVNFIPLIYFFLKSKDFRNRSWMSALISVLLLLFIISIFRVSNGVDSDDSFNVSRRLGTSIGWLMLIVSDMNIMLSAAKWFIYPAALTFFAQYAAFHVVDFRYDSRNEKVASKLFNARVPYSFDKKAWDETKRVSFNFDIMIGHASCGTPSSQGAFRYTPNLKADKYDIPVNKCSQPNSKEIGFTDKYFTLN